MNAALVCMLVALLWQMAAALTARIPANVAEWRYDNTASAQRVWDREMLRHAMASMDVQRLKQVVAKLHSGQPITVAAIGSSIVANYGGCWHKSEDAVRAAVLHPGYVYALNRCSTNVAYLRDFMQFINSLWPHPDHLLINMGVPGAALGVFTQTTCWEHEFPAAADLFVVDNIHVGEGSDQAEVLEKILWQMRMRYGHLPPVVLSNSFRVLSHEQDAERHCMHARNCDPSCANFTSVMENRTSIHQSLQAETQFNMLATYYSFPSISFRSWYLANIRDRTYKSYNLSSVCSLYKLLLSDDIHQSRVGGVLYADMLVALLQEAEQALINQQGSEQPQHVPEMPGFPLFPEGDMVSRRNCYSFETGGFGGQGPVGQVTVLKQEGWEHTIHQLHGDVTRPKPGWVSLRPGSRIQFKVPLAFENKASVQNMMILVGYLSSYEHMGMAEIRCVSASGCTCKPQVENAMHRVTERYSAKRLSYLNTTLAANINECVIEIEVLLDTKSGQHKFKLLDIVVSDAPSSAVSILKSRQGAASTAQSLL